MYLDGLKPLTDLGMGPPLEAAYPWLYKNVPNR